MTQLRTILVPIDGTMPSFSALDHAVALAEDYGARLEVLHVTETRVARSAREEIDRGIETALERARATLGDRVTYRAVPGEPVRRIVEIASEGFDLIVMGTHGRVGRLHAIFGSVAEAVVRNAPCPVLTVRQPCAGYQSFGESRHHRPTVAEQVQEHEHDRGR